MKKKVLLVAVLALLLLAPLTAASTRGTASDGSVGVGLNLGTNTGLGLKFGMGKFDVIANIGVDAMHIGSNGVGLGGDIGAFYEVYDIEIDRRNHLPVTVGLMAPMGFFFGEQFAMNVGVLAAAGIEYTIPDVPINLYLRLGFGVDLGITNNGVEAGFGFSGGVGALWMF